MKSWKRRPLIGRFLIARSPIVVLRTVAPVSITGTAAVTVICSCTPPTDICGLMVSVAPTVNWRERLKVWNPCSSDVRSYGPGGRSGSENTPSALVTTVRV